jgi:hypothetical protein
MLVTFNRVLAALSDNHIIAAFHIGDKDFHTLVEKQKYKSHGVSVLKCVLFM